MIAGHGADDATGAYALGTRKDADNIRVQDTPRTSAILTLCVGHQQLGLQCSQAFPSGMEANNEEVVMEEQNGQMTYRSTCFLSLPHELGTVRDAIKRIIEDIGGEAVYVTKSEGERLRTEIVRGLSRSSVLIADLSSAPQSDSASASNDGPRPAVMWEIGYAESSGMSAIYLCQGKDLVHVPSIIREEHIVKYDINDMPSALKDIKHAIEITIARERSSGKTVFRSNCYFDRRSCDLEVRYLKAREKVRILELNLETIEVQIPTMLRAMTENSGLFVQILTLDPFSEFAVARADQLAELALSYRRQLYESIQKTHDRLSAIDHDRWDLRIYDTFPTQIMFQIDEAIFHSIISLGRRSRGMLHFEVQGFQPNASNTFEAHFATLWNRSMRYEQWCEENRDGVQQLIEGSPELRDAVRNTPGRGPKERDVQQRHSADGASHR